MLNKTLSIKDEISDHRVIKRGTKIFWNILYNHKERWRKRNKEDKFYPDSERILGTPGENGSTRIYDHFDKTWSLLLMQVKKDLTKINFWKTNKEFEVTDREQNGTGWSVDVRREGGDRMKKNYRGDKNGDIENKNIRLLFKVPSLSIYIVKLGIWCLNIIFILKI